MIASAASTGGDTHVGHEIGGSGGGAVEPHPGSRREVAAMPASDPIVLMASRRFIDARALDPTPLVHTACL
jgi:hypothetical protein